MKKTILLTVSLLLCVGTYAQTSDSTSNSQDSTKVPAHSKAEFPGGEDALGMYLVENVRIPESAYECGGSSRVVVRFMVEKDGTLSTISVLKSEFNFRELSKKEIRHREKKGIDLPDYERCKEELEAEAIRVVKTMPRWTPAKQRNKNVRMIFTLPIRFEL